MRNRPPELPGGALAESPIDRALALSLAGERDTALRWAGAAVQNDPTLPSALLVFGRLLAASNRPEIAREALELAAQAGIDSGNLPISVAAASDAKQLGSNYLQMLESVAAAFGASSPRLRSRMSRPPELPTDQEVSPLPSVLTGRALISRSVEILKFARDARQQLMAAQGNPGGLARLALFSELEAAPLAALLAKFEVLTVPTDHTVMRQGEAGEEAYIVARGELEARRTVDQKSTVLARLTAGALFGEMALLTRTPRVASVITRRPSVLLVARKSELDAVARSYPEVGTKLATYCQRRMVQNLAVTSAILRAVEPGERPALVERFVLMNHEAGATIVEQGEVSDGLHLIASGEVSVERTEGDETLVLTSLGPGETFGEVSLVLRKPSTANVRARHPTLTLHLPRTEFMTLIAEHPTILSVVYHLAVRRDEETSHIVAQEPYDVEDMVIV